MHGTGIWLAVFQDFQVFKQIQIGEKGQIFWESAPAPGKVPASPREFVLRKMCNLFCADRDRIPPPLFSLLSFSRDAELLIIQITQNVSMLVLGGA